MDITQAAIANLIKERVKYEIVRDALDAGRE